MYGKKSMTSRSSLFRNTVWLTIAYLFGRGASLIWQILLARFLSDRTEIYGQLGVLISLSSIFIIMAEFGLNISAQQEWPKREFTSATLAGLLGVIRLMTDKVFREKGTAR